MASNDDITAAAGPVFALTILLLAGLLVQGAKTVGLL